MRKAELAFEVSVKHCSKSLIVSGKYARNWVRQWMSRNVFLENLSLPFSSEARAVASTTLVCINIASTLNSHCLQNGIGMSDFNSQIQVREWCNTKIKFKNAHIEFCVRSLLIYFWVRRTKKQLNRYCHSTLNENESRSTLCPQTRVQWEMEWADVDVMCVIRSTTPFNTFLRHFHFSFRAAL